MTVEALPVRRWLVFSSGSRSRHLNLLMSRFTGAENRRAIRAYEKAGFKPVSEYNDAENGPFVRDDGRDLAG